MRRGRCVNEAAYAPRRNPVDRARTEGLAAPGRMMRNWKRSPTAVGGSARGGRARHCSRSRRVPGARLRPRPRAGPRHPRARGVGRVAAARSPGARPARALHRFVRRRVRRLDGSAADAPGGRAGHRRPAAFAVGRPGGARPAAVPGGLVQRRLQVGRLQRCGHRVRELVSQPGRGRRVVDRLRRRLLHRRGVGPRQRPRQDGRRATPEPRHAGRRRRADCGRQRRRATGARRCRASPPCAARSASTRTARWCGPAVG